MPDEYDSPGRNLASIPLASENGSLEAALSRLRRVLVANNRIAEIFVNFSGIQLSEEDVRLLADIASHIAPTLQARLQKGSETRTSQRVHSSLREIEWLLNRDSSPAIECQTDSVPDYGGRVQRDTGPEVRDSVGEELLHAVVSESLCLLDTSAVVFEKNGDYALGLFTSRMMRPQPTRCMRALSAEDNRQGTEPWNGIQPWSPTLTC